ncbi:hypothetical protein C7B79_29785 [Chroococcidiopsis cubana CCALA 043]|nr:hypothetical protein C7B79_29785 [Chroococcidiopsis cubana CCALA 043]
MFNQCLRERHFQFLGRAFVSVHLAYPAYGGSIGMNANRKISMVQIQTSPHPIGKFSLIAGLISEASIFNR